MQISICLFCCWPSDLHGGILGVSVMVLQSIKKEKSLPIVFKPEVYWELVRRKDKGNYSSIDETIRPLIGIPPGPKPHLKKSRDGFDGNRPS